MSILLLEEVPLKRGKVEKLKTA